MSKELGSLSEKYESGGRGIVTISSGKGDPGGKSYGLYQLASKVGTLATFVKKSQFEILRNSPLASAEFDTAWKRVCAEHPVEFREEQWRFIKLTHFDPAFKYWVNELSMLYTNTIGQVLWSMAVQHGGVKKILKSTADSLKSPSEETILKELYLQRSSYVKKNLSGDTLRAVLNRYKTELLGALSMAREEAKIDKKEETKVTPPKPDVSVPPPAPVIIVSEPIPEVKPEPVVVQPEVKPEPVVKKSWWQRLFNRG